MSLPHFLTYAAMLSPPRGGDDEEQFHQTVVGVSWTDDENVLAHYGFLDHHAAFAVRIPSYTIHVRRGVRERVGEENGTLPIPPTMN